MRKALLIVLGFSFAPLFLASAEDGLSQARVNAVFTACEEFELIRNADVVATRIGEAEIAEARAEIAAANWMTMIDGLEQALTQPGRLYSASHKTEFSIQVYVADEQISLVRIFAPVVNGDSEAQFNSMIAAASAAVPDDRELPEWLRTAAMEVWDNYYNEDASIADRLKVRSSGNFSTSVWGVPPDLFSVTVIHQQAE